MSDVNNEETVMTEETEAVEPTEENTAPEQTESGEEPVEEVVETEELEEEAIVEPEEPVEEEPEEEVVPPAPTENTVKLDEEEVVAKFKGIVDQFKNSANAPEKKMRSFVTSMRSGLKSSNGKIYKDELVKLYKNDRLFILDKVNSLYMKIAVTYNSKDADAITSFHALFNRIGTNPKGYHKVLNVDEVLRQNNISEVRYLFLK